ncbi:hypothetical protein SDRG_07713 [Saprolegnia diclina VS20]|uniref:Uncharacterized protein n=1 Tax=Saprolegnia diclina (strain VS20) TaxID=1156394 RepID=T0QAJ4_SAPDV|nr:hypothetical protein SDRG_07713 [Saprolegnia diclina VS20]EQC34914.1 hypothetical protein SDRG_07713 [Saprolegnia diclina VS20]|eukprot:XP_008611786.1 hypothetical protein SDRG_07713 [Saprolegnia diclina VS20]
MKDQRDPTTAPGCVAPAAAPRTDAEAAPPVHEVFGDGNLNAVMLVLLLLHLMQYAMRDPCTC